MNFPLEKHSAHVNIRFPSHWRFLFTSQRKPLFTSPESLFTSSGTFIHIERNTQLLDTGEDPSRYNPTGAHSHSTPLHQAALAGHYDVVTLLVERGARLDLKDTMWQGTPEGWATYGDQTRIAEYLRACRDAAGRHDNRVSRPINDAPMRD